MYHVGIDIGKRRHDATVLDEEGQERLHISFPNTAAGAEQLLARLARLAEVRPEHFGVVVEATAHYWMGLHGFLTARGLTVTVINPLRSSSIRNLYLRKAKTDARDSFLLADLLRMNRVGESQLPDEDDLKLRQLSRLRFHLVDSVTTSKLRALALLDRIFPEYQSCFASVFTKSSRALLKRYTTPKQIAEARPTHLVRLLKEHSAGRVGRQTAQALQERAKQSIGATVALDTLAFQLKLLLAQIEFVEGQIEQISSAIADLMRAREPVILTIPGIGVVLGAAILGEIGDIMRFRGPKNLVAFAGLDVTVHQSGQYQATRCRISKRGSPQLRRAIWLAAVGSRCRDAQLGDLYRRQLARGKHPKVAMGAVARKLTCLIYYICRHNERYDPNYRLRSTHVAESQSAGT